MDAGQDGAGMAVEDALERARVLQDRSIEIAELGVNRRQRRHGVPLAEDKQVLLAAGRIDDVDVQESAVVQGHERNGGRKSTAGMKALVYGVAALLQRQEADVG